MKNSNIPFFQTKDSYEHNNQLNRKKLKTFHPNRNNHSSNFTTMPLNQKKQKPKLVVKIIWGTDKVGSRFVFLKIKNVITCEYYDKFFILLYQSDRIDKAGVEKRIEGIINYFKDHFQISNVPVSVPINKNDEKSSNKNFFFIKGKTFDDYINVRSFYFDSIKDYIVQNGIKNIDQNIFYGDDNYMMRSGILNYMK